MNPLYRPVLSPIRWILSGIFDLLSGGRGLFCPTERRAAEQPCRAVVLTPGLIPTTDIYLKGRLEKWFEEAVCYLNTLRVAPPGVALDETTLVVVVRYAPVRWLRWLERMHGQVAGVAYLMDDDMPQALVAPELPLRYALKTGWRYAMTKRFLIRHCNEVWLSTAELARRYPHTAARVLAPGYVGLSSGGDRAVYYYHGTWAHRCEIKWLVPVVNKVQQVLPGVWFEIMGDDRVRRLFRGIPRVRVVHPMPWTDYLDHADIGNYQVGLAPCFDTDFNRGRSHSKVFDITRTGAAGIYSDGIPYAEPLIHGRTGLLCRNDPDRWVAAIIMLLQDPVLRKNIYRGAKAWCEARLPSSLASDSAVFERETVD